MGSCIVDDVEEGEISDSESLEEISIEDFMKHESQGVKPVSRVRLCADSGLYSLAWAQAVHNRPLNEAEPDDNSDRSSVASIDSKQNNVVIIDLSSDEMDEEKEKGELEEGEIDLDTNSDMRETERRVCLIREALESITGIDVDKSFREACSRLQSSLESLHDILRENNVLGKDFLLQLLFSKVQLLDSAFRSMNTASKGQMKAIFSRSLSLATSQSPPLFSPDKIKEIILMHTSLDSIDVLSTEALKPAVSGFRVTGPKSPLLDLRKDSLPSPTHETTPFLPVPVHTGVLGIANGKVVGNAALNSNKLPSIHPYEADAFKAVSSYQRKFTQASYITNDLPSPTPSVESGDGDGGYADGEVSSSSATGNLITKSLTARNVAPMICKANLSSKASAKSRDPRLRFANFEAGPLDINQSPSLVGRDTNKMEPVAITGLDLRKQKLAEEHSSEGRASKRQRNLPITDTGKPDVIMSKQVPRTSANSTASLPNELERVADNPAMSCVNIKTGQEHRSTVQDRQKAAIPARKGIRSNSITGAVPSTNTLPTQSGTLHIPPQMANTDNLGNIRLKTRDPRRFLHGNALERSVSLGPEQLKVNGQPTTTASVMKGAKNPQKLGDGRKTKDTASVPLASVIPPVVSQNLTSQAMLIKMDRADANTVSSTLEKHRVVAAACPPHPQNAWGGVEHIFEGYNEQQKAAIQRERSRRIDEQKQMFSAHKLCLVLDLDHTLLNSAKFGEIDPVHNEMLRKKEDEDHEKSKRHLFRFNHMGMWTKLRPGIWNFLEKASKLYELHVYTMGNKAYATQMAKVLDPKGVLFNGRVISKGDDMDIVDGDERVPKIKDLDGVLGMESAVVIIDDSAKVWPHNKMNLIVVERYTYFPCSRRQFGMNGPSLLEADRDERLEDGTLASSLAVIERIHENFFGHKSLEEADVRNILATERRKILSGCRIVFSRVIPLEDANPHLHHLWQTAEQFGAVCVNQIDNQVTHVVAHSLGTDKVKWAISNGRHVVHPDWVQACSLLYRRMDENDFVVKPPQQLKPPS